MSVISGLVLALGLAAQVAKADFIFGRPQTVGPPGSFVLGVSVTADQLELYASSNRAGGLGARDLWVTTRASINEAWGPPVNLGAPVDSQYNEVYPSVSADGLTLYFSDYLGGMGAGDRPGGVGGHDIWMSTRSSRNDPWTAPVNMGAPINSSTEDMSPTISHDGLTLIFASKRDPGKGYYDLWMSARPTTQDDWGPPVNMGAPVNTGSGEWNGNLSSDGLVLFFETGPSGDMANQVCMTTRKSRNDPWGPPILLDLPIDTLAGIPGCGSLSADGRAFYFSHTGQIFCLPILPVVDFTGDGKVELRDFSKLAQYWGQDESSVDIGPMPWGDGTVDIHDVAVLAEYWLKDLRPVAHWKFDGDPNDSSGNGNHGTEIGNPTYAQGKVERAINLDGIDDYVSTPFVLDPAGGPFSVFAWVKGGAPGQVMLSQQGGANWLMADTSAGNLMTELKESGRRGKPLASQTVITDADWHRVALVWDGTNRILYVDGVEVAGDVQFDLEGLVAGLNIGCGANREAGSFFSGLIDDVRIYDRAVLP